MWIDLIKCWSLKKYKGKTLGLNFIHKNKKEKWKDKRDVFIRACTLLYTFGTSSVEDQSKSSADVNFVYSRLRLFVYLRYSRNLLFTFASNSLRKIVWCHSTITVAFGFMFLRSIIFEMWVLETHFCYFFLLLYKFRGLLWLLRLARMSRNS